MKHSLQITTSVIFNHIRIILTTYTTRFLECKKITVRILGYVIINTMYWLLWLKAMKASLLMRYFLWLIIVYLSLDTTCCHIIVANLLISTCLIGHLVSKVGKQLSIVSHMGLNLLLCCLMLQKKPSCRTHFTSISHCLILFKRSVLSSLSSS